jgi:phage tail-like protein
MTFPTSPLARRLGLAGGSGLIAPLNHVPAGGTLSYVLGSDAPGVVEKVSVGDYVEIAALGDLQTNGYSYAQVTAHFRPPKTAMPSGVFWRFTFWAVDPAGVASPSPRVTYDLVGTNNREVTHTFSIPLLGVITTTTQKLRARVELAGTAGEYTVELPAVYVDTFNLSLQTARTTVINAIPENGETGVLINAPIVLEINDPTATAIGGGNVKQADTKVYVNGALAYDGSGSGFQAGWNGAGSVANFATGPDGARTATMTIVPTTLFTSNQTVQVEVVTTAYSGSPPTHFYSFTVEDITAPVLSSAVAPDRRVVNVVASEPLLAANASGVNDALNPANWSIVVASTSLDDGLPAYVPNIVSVTQVDAITFALQLDSETTRGALYLVVAGALEDLDGNFMVAPNNRAYFSGYACQTPDGREFSLIDLLPDMNANEDDSLDLHKFMACLQEVTDLLLCDIDHWTDILDPDFAPERFVDAMLADMGNPFAFDLALIDKRRLIRVLVPIYQSKGTDPGIINAVRFFLGLTITISVPAFDATWTLGVDYLGDGTWLGTSSLHDRLSFYVVSPITLTPDQRTKITALVNYMKDARTHFLGIQEPTPPPPVPNHWELGLSQLGVNTLLH